LEHPVQDLKVGKMQNRDAISVMLTAVFARYVLATEGGAFKVDAPKDRWQRGELKEINHSWMVRWYDSAGKRHMKKLGRVRDFPTRESILSLFEAFMVIANGVDMPMKNEPLGIQNPITT